MNTSGQVYGGAGVGASTGVGGGASVGVGVGQSVLLHDPNQAPATTAAPPPAPLLP